MKTFYEFVKEHDLYYNDVYKYYIKNSIFFNFYEEDYLRSLIRCGYVIDKHNILRGINPIVPDFVDDITSMINIHEYVHTLCMYDRLNKRYKKPSYMEPLAVFYEKLYVKERNTAEVKKYGDFLDKIALDTGDRDYLSALTISNELLKDYQNDGFNQMIKRTKKLVRKID